MISKCTEYATLISELYSGWKKRYWQEVAKNGKVVPVVPIQEAIGDHAVEDIKRFSMPRPKECFRNAFNITIDFPDFIYVEGIVSVCGMVIDHAWNRTKDGKYFDATYDLLDIGLATEYMPLYEGEASDITRLSLASGVFGGYAQQVFRENFGVLIKESTEA